MIRHTAFHVTHLVPIALLAFAAPGCGEDSEGPVPRPQSLIVDAPTGDQPAQQAFRRLSDRLDRATGNPLSIGVYEIASAAESKATVRAGVAARAAVLLGKQVAEQAVESDASGTEVKVRDGERVLEYNSISGSERFLDLSRHFRGKPVAESSLPAESEWVARGRAYVAGQIPALAGANLRPFKIKRTFEAHSVGNGTVNDGVSQVSVAFSSDVNGWPLLASHPDVVVHFSPDGTSVGHEVDRRPAGKLLKTLKESEVLSPITARARARERLQSSGLNLADFTEKKSLFGYLKLGRRDAQSALVPHYAFFFEPNPGVMSKILVELVPAASDAESLALAKADDTRVAERKRGLTATPGTRR